MYNLYTKLEKILEICKRQIQPLNATDFLQSSEKKLFW